MASNLERKPFAQRQDTHSLSSLSYPNMLLSFNLNSDPDYCMGMRQMFMLLLQGWPSGCVLCYGSLRTKLACTDAELAAPSIPWSPSIKCWATLLKQ